MIREKQKLWFGFIGNRRDVLNDAGILKINA